MGTKRTLRYPTEVATLGVTLGLTLALIVALSTFTIGAVAIVAALGFLYNLGMAAWRVRRVKLLALPPARVSHVFGIVERCRQRLAMRQRVDVFVVDSPVVNAYAVGLREPYTIVLHMGLLRQLDDGELAYVIGHELGHVKLGHTTILALTGQLGMHTYGVPVLGYFFRYLFLLWMRVSEYSADRAGLVACGNLENAISTQLKLTLDPKSAAMVDLPSVITHWRTHDVGAVAQLRDVLSTHPNVHARLDKLVDFAQDLPEAAM